MNNFVIYTDSACDLKPDVLKSLNVECIQLSFRFDNEDKDYLNNEMDINTFYNRMKNGETAKTAAVNPEGFTAAFEKSLSDGKDILYLGFSSGLSTTYNSACIAAEDLGKKYPDNKIICLDTLAASAGQGMLVYLAAKKRDSGADLETVAEYIEGIKLNLCHWFTVDDLVYLKRGGRVSPTVAFVGGMLGIKPILHVDNEGRLISVSKVRGRKASITAIAEKYGEYALKNTDPLVFISHSACQDDAELLKKIISEKYGVNVEIITDVGTVIGAHSGPGTLALFFLGKER